MSVSTIKELMRKQVMGTVTVTLQLARVKLQPIFYQVSYTQSGVQSRGFLREIKLWKNMQCMMKVKGNWRFIPLLHVMSYFPLEKQRKRLLSEESTKKFLVEVQG